MKRIFHSVGDQILVDYAALVDMAKEFGLEFSDEEETYLLNQN